MTKISPITDFQQDQVIEKTLEYIDLARQLFACRFDPIPVQFKLTGRAAGMYHVKNGQRYIRYNPYIFAKYFEDNLENTVPHEVAHYIADRLYGIKTIRPHGREWQEIMHRFGVKALTHCHYDLQGIPQRRHRRFTYRCQCAQHELTTRRHNMILNGERAYHCRSCHDTLRYTGNKK